MLHPTFAIRVPHKESQMIHSTQQLSGSALSFFCASSANAVVYDLADVITSFGDTITGSLNVDTSGNIGQYSFTALNKSNVVVAQFTNGPGSFQLSGPNPAGPGNFSLIFGNSTAFLDLNLRTSGVDPSTGLPVWSDAPFFGLVFASQLFTPGIAGGGVFVNGELIQEVAATPLPAALPLFATGLGALGLFRWRRQRKAVTT
jgi:hypothetical protein